MKKQLSLSFSLILLVLSSCNKKSTTAQPQQNTPATENNLFGPYGKESAWESIGGDTIFEDKLTLVHFYTEKNTPCNICYYQQNISFWNDYDYTFSVSECAVANDTLTFVDIDSGRKAIFKREE